VSLFHDGGPGGPAVLGMVAFLGPYRVDPATNTFVHREKFAWSSDVHMIVVDNPAGIGEREINWCD